MSPQELNDAIRHDPAVVAAQAEVDRAEYAHDVALLDLGRVLRTVQEKFGYTPPPKRISA